nr:reverse transcriptase domain-containing protein [Tanacetum cinerariifolium]
VQDKFKIKTLAKFFDEVGITQQFSIARTPQQNGILERRNRTLVEAARTMLTFANLPSFLWAEAIATACFTQNRTIIPKHFDKTPYELIIKRKPNIKFFRVFKCRCYLLNNYEDVGKLKAKGDIGVFVGYSKESAAFRIYNKQTFSKVSEASKKDLEDLFQDFYDEYFDSSKIMKSSTTNVETSIIEKVFHKVSESFQGESSSSSLNDDVQQSPEEDDYFDASTSFHDPLNVHTYYQPYLHEKKWTKDHPLYKIIGDPKSSVRTRGQLANSCLFLCLLSSIEPANVAEALRDADWIQVAQKKIKIAFKNADSSSRVELIPSNINGPHPFHQCLTNDGNCFPEYRDNIQGYVSAGAQTQVAPSNELSNYKKINDANMKALQNQINTVKNELRNEMQTSMSNQTNKLKNMMAIFFQMSTASSPGSGSLPSNTIANPRGDLKAITTQSGVSYDRPPIPPSFSFLPKVVERVPKPKPTIPYPLRVNKQKLREKDDNLAIKFVKIFRKLHFDISFADALLHMPKFATLFKSLLNNEEKLFNLATTLVNENCSAVILKKFPQKLRDPAKFLIPCDFPKLVERLALADLGASINLMPFSIWEKLSLPELTPTQMILEIADRLTTRPTGIAEDVFMKVGKFHFPTDFEVVDYVVDPRVPLILERPFLRTGRALIDVYVLGFLEIPKSGNPTLILDPIIALSSPSLTPFEGGDIILEEIEACLASKSIPSGINDTDFDLKGDILLIQKLLNDDPSSPLPPKELNLEELKTVKSSIDDPLELDL